ncbi:DUF3179 domain-containing protein [Marinimicrococcus flavescens]|uniref:DUF3179 domain-containing protein n=1 Tax=Marinimicrococcus flavescens TaxID=3031815 RepID=A0AAP3UYA9_9PROT|nr:DUF3179 domain-containing protein [Marinimicrococcus flavescens]
MRALARPVRICALLSGMLLALSPLLAAGPGRTAPAAWQAEWPRTDFGRHAIELGEIMSGGPPKDGIPAIDAPRFHPVGREEELAPQEPVIGLELGGLARAYPLRILMWHEIVNDRLGGVPVAVTYCPLCNAAIVFDRRVDGRVLDFGTTGKLRHSDLVMYDRQTESWWQQFSGEAVVGAMTGTRLAMLPARLESFASFTERAPHGEVLAPPEPRQRPYGSNPYVGYDSAAMPFLYRGEVPEGIAPLARVVVVGERAWSLEKLRSAGEIHLDGLRLSWRPGQVSALDAPVIAESREVGDVVVERRTDSGFEDVAHHVTFAFVFHAFHPGAAIER